MEWLQWWEMASYVVTVVGLPLAIAVFVMEQRKERQNDDEEVYQRLSDEYMEFLKLVLDNSDLHLLNVDGAKTTLSAEQQERKYVIFGILVALFERAYLLVYEEKMGRQTRRLWQSWDDYMREWCRREDFRTIMSHHLEGEDPEFREYITRIADHEAMHGSSSKSSRWKPE
jgi:hypothetical protein